jgi:hypothetical protein
MRQQRSSNDLSCSSPVEKIPSCWPILHSERIGQTGFTPMPHIGTGHNFAETPAFRDEMVERLECRLLVA